MTVIFEYAMTWVDERLSWDPKEYDDIDHIYVLRNNVWIPEITPFDSLEVVETRPDYKQHVPITYQGVASFYTSIVTSVVCPIDVTFFPFDEQNCSMKLLSYSFFSVEIAMQNEINKNLQISGVGNDEWEVTNILARSEIRSNASESDQINEFTFFMKRNPSYYVALIIVPSFMLTFLCVAGLFTSPLIVDDLEKFCMGLTTIMSTTVMIGIVAENIPKTKIIPHLNVLKMQTEGNLGYAQLPGSRCIVKTGKFHTNGFGYQVAIHVCDYVILCV
ncbi:Neurotransmitter-gated ion-channel ligand binding domain protein [Ancylostoma caninum]|uniref:Neurotransmitter-gated ion-channel ligand binding domain protein n=1 Tax=Ancylostoma caninum TaxID=29170 RepID=A0A368FU06_ANCCA|nr:Neurotransmitter-gated ion-channel ligand binding domain protein [Ancylostoma caninum]